MIRYTQGNLLETDAEALVNTVNEVGVMGKGIALQVAETFPENAEEYRAAAKRGEVRVGHVLVTERDSFVGPRWILHFPTKKHWRNRSRLEWIREGLTDLIRVLQEKGIRSVALPPLGCGAGGLRWEDVRGEIERGLEAIPYVEVQVFEPTPEYHTRPMRSGVHHLTPARALVVELIRRYSILGLECTLLEVQKLAWFLQRFIEGSGGTSPLRLKFVANRYGPYADSLRHLLNDLDGSYLRAERRVADAGPLEPIYFEEARREEVASYLKSEELREHLPALERTSRVIDGFESPLGMELLATVDWLLHESGRRPTVEDVRQGIRTWPGGPGAAERKARILDEGLIELALERLTAVAGEQE